MKHLKRLLIALGALVVGGIVWAINAWEYQTIGPSQVRRHLVRGIVEIKRQGRWEAPFVVEPRAPLLGRDDVKRVKLRNIAWGEGGLLGATADIGPGKPLQGRLAFVIRITETKEGKMVRDRAVRQTISWPGGQSIPFVLSTGLFKPIQNQQTMVHLEPIE